MYIPAAFVEDDVEKSLIVPTSMGDDSGAGRTAGTANVADPRRVSTLGLRLSPTNSPRTLTARSYSAAGKPSIRMEPSAAG
jgi:hypothetical protein